jgi:hypothetical protein
MLAVVGLLVPALVQAQHSGHSSSPYAGLEQRPIKALSAEQIDDLRIGRGMGLALAAELNGYPGPMHVIDLATELGLSASQLARMRELFDAMKAETVPIGERLIAQEADLDRLFARQTITLESLAQTTASIGGTQAALRAAHLKYHLATVGVLTAAQVVRYSELRGYSRPHNPMTPGHRP